MISSKIFCRIISRQKFTREEYLKVFIDSSLAFVPGTGSRWGYFTLGYLMEKVTGKTYQQLMKDDIFNVLKMENSRCIITPKLYPTGLRAMIISSATPVAISETKPIPSAGDLYSTVEDMFGTILLCQKIRCSIKI